VRQDHLKKTRELLSRDLHTNIILRAY
jgi:hypothetical protein